METWTIGLGEVGRMRPTLYYCENVHMPVVFHRRGDAVRFARQLGLRAFVVQCVNKGTDFAEQLKKCGHTRICVNPVVGASVLRSASLDDFARGVDANWECN